METKLDSLLQLLQQSESRMASEMKAIKLAVDTIKPEIAAIKRSLDLLKPTAIARPTAVATVNHSDTPMVTVEVMATVIKPLVLAPTLPLLSFAINEPDKSTLAKCLTECSVDHTNMVPVSANAEDVAAHELFEEMPPQLTFEGEAWSWRLQLKPPWPPPQIGTLGFSSRGFFNERLMGLKPWTDELQEIFGNSASFGLQHCSSNGPRGTILAVLQAQMLQLLVHTTLVLPPCSIPGFPLWVIIRSIEVKLFSNGLEQSIILNLIDGTPVLFLYHHSSLGLVIPGVLVTWPHSSMGKITALFSNEISFHAHSMSSVNKVLLQRYNSFSIWTYFGKESLIGILLLDWLLSNFAGHITQYGFDLFQWNITWLHHWKCSGKASGNLRENLLPIVGKGIFQVKFLFVYYWAGVVVACSVFATRLRPTETYSILCDMKCNTAPALFLSLVFDRQVVFQGGRCAVISIILYLTHDSYIDSLDLLVSIGLKVLQVPWDPGVCNVALSAAFQKVQLHWKIPWDLGGVMFALSSSHKWWTTPELTYLHCSKHRRWLSVLLAYASRIWLVAWDVDDLELSTGCRQVPSQGGRNAMSRAIFSDQAHVDHDYYVVFINEILVGYDNYLDQVYYFGSVYNNFIYYHEGYRGDSNKMKEVHAPGDPGKSDLRYLRKSSAWGQAEFQGGRNVMTLAWVTQVGPSSWASDNGLGPNDLPGAKENTYTLLEAMNRPSRWITNGKDGSLLPPLYSSASLP